MPKKHTKLSIDEHKLLAKKMLELKLLSDEVDAEIIRAYGKSSVPGKMSRSVFGQVSSRRLDKLFFEMDNCVARETSREDWDKNKYDRIYMGLY